MSKDALDLNDLPLTQETTAMQTSLDAFNAFINAPVTKLDADEYMANDLDGVTEGLLGSGNMNFLMMQAGQTDEAMSNSNPFNIHLSDASLPSSGILGGNSYTPVPGGGADTATDRALDMPNAFDGLSGSGGEGQNNNVGSLSALTAARNSQSVTPFSDTSSFSNSNTGSNGADGGNGRSGTNGQDGEGGGDTTVTNNTFNNTDVTNVDNDFLDTDITNNIDEGILENVENIYNNTTDFLTTVVNNTTDIINNLFDNPLDFGPIGVDLRGAADDLLDLNLDLINGDNVLTVLDETVDLSPVANIVEGLTGNIFADLGLTAILDPFQYEDSASDFDLNANLDLLNLGLPEIDLNLDPVEFILGDIDMGVNLSEDLLGSLPLLGGGTDDTDLELAGLENIVDLAPVTNLVEGLFNPVEDIVGDVDILGNLNVGLLGLGADDGDSDTDFTIPLDIDLIDSDLLNNGLEISLDPVEDIMGDVDLNLGVAGDVLGAFADGLIDNEAGGAGTESLLADAGNTLTDIASGILSMEGETGDTDILLDTNLGLPGEELVDNTTGILLDPVENLLGDIDLGGNAGLGLLGTGDFADAGDSDLSLDIDLIDAGIDPVEVNLDAVESIVGDIDLDIGGSTEIVDTLSDPETLLEDTVGIVEDTIDTALGLIESLPESTGGLDLDALLPSDSGGGEDLLSSWTETLLPDAGDLLGGGLTSDLSDVLSDPTSPVPVIEIPVIPVIPAPTLPVGGGLFGGLFG